MKDNLSIGPIAETVNKSNGVVHGILKVYNAYSSYEARKSKRRPRITTRDDRAIVKFVKKDRFKTAATVSQEMNTQLGKLLLGRLCLVV